jgi:AcrR family transcriptional regulator
MRAKKVDNPTRTRAGVKPPRPGTPRELLRAGGEVFGEKGIHAATGQEICHRAGVNTAAINYYFGGLSGLYEAVLVDAIQQVGKIQALSKIAATGSDAREQLSAIITMLVTAATKRTTETWVIRVLLRELLTPSSTFERLFLEAEILPKGQIFRKVVAEIMGLPVDHPAVAQGCICVFAPWQMVIVSPDNMLNRVFPAFDLRASNGIVAERAIAFALGGLDALAKAESIRPNHTATETKPSHRPNARRRAGGR